MRCLILTALLLTSCSQAKVRYEPRPDFYINVYPKFIFWSLEASVKVDVFVEPSTENCHMGIAWQNSTSTWDIDERSSRLQGRIIRLRDLTPGEHKIVAVIWKCDGTQVRQEFTFRVLDGVP